ncbi:HAD family hydrolase [Paenibacillus hubeiensis]|uniref:HAD family hydrolase n=1 Tax=Paenibacillus hubeiensis TaxID=3077330 RepID=UPI0031BAB71F
MDAIFLDFYGTVVHEDDHILPSIYEQVRAAAGVDCTTHDIGSYWWQAFSRMFHDSHGSRFVSQRELNVRSLAETLRHFQADLQPRELNREQLAHWRRPGIFADSIPFLEAVPLPVYILSNIDTDDIMASMAHHGLNAAGVITSEDVRAYKPRPEMFQEALARYGLQPERVIHVGDSLVSDVYGAQSVGIRAVWLNRNSRPLKGDCIPDNECSDLMQVLDLL